MTQPRLCKKTKNEKRRRNLGNEESGLYMPPTGERMQKEGQAQTRHLLLARQEKHFERRMEGQAKKATS